MRHVETLLYVADPTHVCVCVCVSSHTFPTMRTLSGQWFSPIYTMFLPPNTLQPWIATAAITYDMLPKLVDADWKELIPEVSLQRTDHAHCLTVTLKASLRLNLYATDVVM